MNFKSRSGSISSGVRRYGIIDLEGGGEEVLHLHAFGEDLGIEIRLDDAKTGIVIITKSGMWRQPLEVS